VKLVLDGIGRKLMDRQRKLWRLDDWRGRKLPFVDLKRRELPDQVRQ
jgi:hypothetical protein